MGKATGPTVLVVDDVGYSLHLLGRLVESLGYRVITAQSAKEGLDKLRSEPVALVLTDLMMPEVDGIQFHASALQLEKNFDGSPFHKPPFMLVTAFTDQAEDMVQEAVSHGFADVVLKPIDRQRLSETVNKWIHKITETPSVPTAPQQASSPHPAIQSDYTLDGIVDFLEQKFPGAKKKIAGLSHQ